jgi:hypothetical protein
MNKNSSVFIVYGRAETTLWGKNSDRKKPGYQFLATSENLDPALQKKLYSAVILDSGETYRLWSANGREDEPLWTYCDLGDGCFALGKTLFFTNREYLDKAGRIASVSHVIFLSPEDNHLLKGSPFPLIESNEKIFIDSVEDIVELVQGDSKNIPFSKNIPRVDSLALPSDPSEDIDGFDSDSIDRLLKDKKFLNCPITLRGTYHETLEFMQTMFSVAPISLRKHLSFTMLCRSEDYANTRIQVGKRSPGKIYVNLESKSIQYPASPSEFTAISPPASSDEGNVEKNVPREESPQPADFPRFLKNDPKLIQAIIVFGVLFAGYGLFKVFKSVDGKPAAIQQEDRVAAPQQATPFGKTFVDTQKLQISTLTDLVPRFHSFPEALSSPEAAGKDNCFALGFDNWTSTPKPNEDLFLTGPEPFCISGYITAAQLMFVFDEATLQQIQQCADLQQVKLLIEKSLSKLNCKISEDNPQQNVLDRDVLVPFEVAENYGIRLTLRYGFNYQYRLPTSSHGRSANAMMKKINSNLLPVQEHFRDEASNPVSGLPRVSHSREAEDSMPEKIKRFRILRTSQVTLENAFSVKLFDCNP